MSNRISMKRSGLKGEKLAVGYIRVSTEGQVEEGVSLDDQRARIEAWALAHGYTLLHVHADEGRSGTRADNRPGLQAALRAVCECGGVLVCTKLDRLTRSVPDAHAIAERVQACGADLAIMDMGVDTSTAAGSAFFTIAAAFAQLFRDQISENTRAALAHKRKLGERVGGVPYGYVLSGDGVQLAPNPDEQRGLERMRALRVQGHSYRSIARILDGELVKPKSAESWSAAAVSKILSRDSEPVPAGR